MALKNCPECGKEVSDKAKNCPNCGYPLINNKTKENKKENGEKILNEDNKDEDKSKKERESLAAEETKETKNSSNGKKGHGFLYVLILITFLLSFYNFLSSYRDNNKEDINDNNTYLEESIQKNRESIAMNRLSLTSSEGVVTDKLVVQKALFYMWDDGSIYANIDVRPQPIYSSKFLGGGEFDLTDRELRSSLEEICEEVIDNTKISIENLSYDKKIEIKRIYITANNYEVGIYENDSIKLSGE